MTTPSDDQIGRRIREARMDAAMTQAQLASLLGCSSQQIHKYERGDNRVSAGTLFVISNALDRPIDWFFRDPGGIGETLPLNPSKLH
ncbi:MAG: helix-turn-helix domain-containing protein [Henriciella sp.]